jgi:hypothetical protein
MGRVEGVSPRWWVIGVILLASLLAPGTHAEILATWPGGGLGQPRVQLLANPSVAEYPPCCLTPPQPLPFAEELEGAAAGADGDFYVTQNNLGRGAIVKIDGCSGAFLGVFADLTVGTSTTIPVALTVGATGHLFTLGYEFDEFYQVKGVRILQHDGRDGAFMRVLVDVGASGLTAPADLCFTPGRQLLVADLTAGVLRFTGSGRPLETPLIPQGAGSLDGAAGLAIRPDGMLYVSSVRTHSVLRYRVTTLSAEFVDVLVSPGREGLTAPAGLALDPDGTRLYVCSTGTGSVLQFHPETGVFLGALTKRTFPVTGPTAVAATAARPRLSASLLATGLQLSWPAAASNYVLEVRGTLEGGNPWMPVAESPKLVGDQQVLSPQARDGDRLYRLRRR